jgi:hypothetical protein
MFSFSPLPTCSLHLVYSYTAAAACVTSVDPGPHALAAPPIFVIYSGWPLATGAIQIVTGTVGVIVAVLQPHVVRSWLVTALTIFNCIWQVLTLVFVHVGIVSQRSVVVGSVGEW